jgi:hypothetical protein
LPSVLSFYRCCHPSFLRLGFHPCFPQSILRLPSVLSLYCRCRPNLFPTSSGCHLSYALSFPYRRANKRFRTSGSVAKNSPRVTPASVNSDLTCSHARSNPRPSRKTTNASPTRKTSTRAPIPIPKSSRNRFGTVISPFSPIFVVVRNSIHLDCVGIAKP